MRGLVFALFLLICGNCYAQGARSYYNELYKAGGLDRMADGHVCFDDNAALETFFIFGQSKDLKEYLEETKDFEKASPRLKAQLNRGFLNLRGYDRGVVIGPEDFYYKDDDSWMTEPFSVGKGTRARMRLTISWQTLRYKRSIEILNPDSTVKGTAISTYGKCESVPYTVDQKGD
jgi:hypothetical protein